MQAGTAHTKAFGEPEPVAVFELGERIGDTFQITSVLGHGGMGVVFEAEDLQCRRRVAIKMMLRADAEHLLRREAQAAAALQHAGLPTVYALGSHRNIPYLVMERLYGQSLELHLARAGRLEIAGTLAILTQLADTLATLHHTGLAHRDIKPANIMLCPNGRVVVVDFGIAVPEVELIGAPMQLPCGTPYYMAPEAVSGHVKPGQAHLLDIYAFGALAHEMLSGAPPFSSENFLVVLEQQLSVEPPRLSSLRSDVPPALDAIVASCLSKDPADRPDIDTVVWELRGLCARSPRRTVEPRSVLIVDDDADAVELIKACARTRLPAAQVRTVTSCEGALALLRRSLPELMFVDLALPGMSGIDLCSVLHGAGLTERTTIVAVSALHDDWILRVLRGLGVGHFIPKGSGLPQRLMAVMGSVGEAGRRHSSGSP